LFEFFKIKYIYPLYPFGPYDAPAHKKNTVYAFFLTRAKIYPLFNPFCPFFFSGALYTGLNYGFFGALGGAKNKNDPSDPVKVKIRTPPKKE
jgi:hypothetical protein